MPATGEHFTTSAGAAVFRGGDRGNSCCLPIAGEVAVDKRRAGKTVELKRPGEPSLVLAGQRGR